jgi:hypothetical protein
MELFHKYEKLIHQGNINIKKYKRTLYEPYILNTYKTNIHGNRRKNWQIMCSKTV